MSVCVYYERDTRKSARDVPVTKQGLRPQQSSAVNPHSPGAMCILAQYPCNTDSERRAYVRIHGDEIHCVGGPAWEVARASSRGVLKHGAHM